MEPEVSLRGVKQVAAKLEEPLRTLILSEADSLPLKEYFVKSDLWLRMLLIKRSDDLYH